MSFSSAVFSVVARNYLAFARTLMDSVAMHEPEMDRFVFLVDAADDVPAITGVRLLTPPDVFSYDFYSGLAYSSDVTELSTAVKPFVLRHLLESGYERAYYFDPDIELFADLAPVTRRLDDGDVVLTPHITEPIPLDGLQPDEIALLQAGAYNLGFIGVRRGDATSLMLDWWADRLERYCVNDVAVGLFTDQKWVDLVPGMVDGCEIVRDPGCNVAYWNLHARRLDPVVPGRLASGEPLVFFHYSGFDVRRPERLSKYQTRIVVADEPGLAALLDGYAKRVQANGFAETSTIPYGYARFSNGVPLDAYARVVLRDARLSGIRFPDPNDVVAQPSAWRYLNERADEDCAARGPAHLTRYFYAIWKRRPDLRAAFPNVLGADRAPFFQWLLADRSARINGAYLAAAGLHGAAPASRGDSPAIGVNVVGYFRTESGVGEAGRGQLAALREAGIRARVVDFSDFAPSRADDTSAGHFRGAPAERVNLVCVNAADVPLFLQQPAAELLAGRYNIGSWWWELAQFPNRWLRSFDPFDEIWVGTQFVATAVSAKSPVPVVQIPPVVEVGAVRIGLKAQFGFPEHGTVFLFMFDYRSLLDRKNPLGAIEAFARAFPDRAEPVQLVIKSINAAADPAGRERVRAAAHGDRRIVLLEHYLTRVEKNELLGACDAYVSLHRSEGFGYTIAEAMAVGKPVVATPWSGPADFLTRANSFSLEYELIEIAADCGPYPAGQVWADPDLDDAARAMRSIYERRDEAIARGERGRADILSRYSAVVVARAVSDRLALVDARLSRR